MEMFLNPWYMVAGGAMVSSPIIIHFINRLRFRRIRWAAMEFLLKAQKKNRRRLIIEQLILLLLRCLLVLLAAFLVARAVRSAVDAREAEKAKQTISTHVVVLDDTLSMRDKWKDLGQSKTTFDRAKAQIKDVVEILGRQEAPQYLEIYLLSNGKRVFPKDDNKPKNPEAENQVGELLNANSHKSVEAALQPLQATFLHEKPLTGAQVAQKRIEAAQKLPQGQNGKYLIHFVCDFREHEWSLGDEAKALRERLAALSTAGYETTLIDCGHPFRTTDNANVPSHENVAIVSFRAEAPVAVVGRDIEFTIEVANFGEVTPDSIHVSVFKDGSPDEDLNLSRPMTAVPAPEKIGVYSFKARFDKAGYTVLRAQLRDQDAETGLHVDNEAYAVLEVREKLDVLVIDGNRRRGDEDSRDLQELKNILLSAQEYNVVVAPDDVESGPPTALEVLDRLKDIGDRFSAIYLINVPRISNKSPKMVEKVGADGAKGGMEVEDFDSRLDQLQEYVRRGGNVAFFVGDDVITDYYRRVLYEYADGLFPVPLTGKSPDLTPEQIEARRDSDQPKLIVHRPATTSEAPHEVIYGLSQFEDFKLTRIMLDKWVTTKIRTDWTAGHNVRELVNLPNQAKLADFKGRAQDLYNEVDVLIKELESNPDKLFGNLTKKERDTILEKLMFRLKRKHRDFFDSFEGTGKQLSDLGRAIHEMINDQGDQTDRDTSPQPFWSHPDVRRMTSRLRRFANDVLYGPPLVVERQYGKGHVVACLTTLSPTWHNWQVSTPPGRFGFPIFMVDLAHYLTKTGEVPEPINFGDKITFRVDAKRFSNDAVPKVLSDPHFNLDPGKKTHNQTGKFEYALLPELPRLTGKAINDAQGEARYYEFSFDKMEKPGIAQFILEERGKPNNANPPARYFAVNLNARAESPLRRANLQDVTRPYVGEGKEPQQLSNLQALYEKRDLSRAFDVRKKQEAIEHENDWSRSPWLYLVIMIVLIAEQAMAVHMSRHSRAPKTTDAVVGPATITGEATRRTAVA